ncbi:MAG TPA: DUF977 family protein [Vicinamibacterales bacterium]|nr:DUF977 family protein [Vicinamibacterales bacterium]
MRIYELTKERGQVKIDDVIRVTSAARGTVKDHVSQLIKNGYLVPHGRGKGSARHDQPRAWSMIAPMVGDQAVTVD